MDIEHIIEVRRYKNHTSMTGTLRNQRRFNINDEVWLASYSNEILFFRAIVTGVWLSKDENPDYLYEVIIPKSVASKAITHNLKLEGEKRDSIKCDRLFESIEQATEESIKRLRDIYNIDMEAMISTFDRLIEHHKNDN